MIFFVTAPPHKYGPLEIEDMPGAPETIVISYNQLLRRKSLPRAAYVFSDFDRLPSWHVELAAKIYRHLKADGLPVFNDPARVLHRLPLLKRLHRAGLNQFQVWDAAADDLPDRYPVFLRTQHGHRGTITDLLENRTAAKQALISALDQGYGLQDLMFTEYCAEPLENGVFRKLAAFRMGDHSQMTPAVHERHWHAKFGEDGAGTADQYQADFEMIKTNPFNDALRSAFDVANIEYGRADFAIVDGRPQVYEINTNPHISLFEEHPFEVRLASQAVFVDRFSAALQAVDFPFDGRKRVALDHPDLQAQRKNDRFVFHQRSVI